jgi:hypothetical protein
MQRVPQLSFYIDVVRRGLQWMVDGPARDKGHPAHDPLIWFVEATSAVFDDSGLARVLDSPRAREVLGVPLRDDLIRLEQAVREAERMVRHDPPAARARLAGPAHAVLSDLDREAPSGAKTSGVPLD